MADMGKINAFFNHFEAPKWKPIALHAIHCIVAYPILFGFVLLAHERTLFWTRSIVAVGCTLVGFRLGLSLLELARPFLEAATWATVIHLSRAEDDQGNKGIKLADLAAASADATSSFVGVKLLWTRARQYKPWTSRPVRRTYDQRVWSLYVLFFLLLTTLTASMSFILGRLIDINATLAHQSRQYVEVTIGGVNSPDDIERAKEFEAAAPKLSFFLPWTAETFSSRNRLPLISSTDFENDKVYFSETMLSQLLPGGRGYGTFDNGFYNPSLVADPENTTMPNMTRKDSDADIDPGYLLRFPKWGTRMHCAKLPNPETNLIPQDGSNQTVVFVPLQTLRDLFSSSNQTFDETGFPQNFTEGVPYTGTIPANIALTWSFANLGFPIRVQSASYAKETADFNKGWATIEVVLIRLDTAFAPQGKFAAVGNLTTPTGTIRVGYDSAVCLQLIEPWIVEVYNSTTSTPSTLRVIGPGNGIEDAGELGMGMRRHGSLPADSSATRKLVSTNLTDIYYATYLSSLITLYKTGDVRYYAISQSILSITDGVGFKGYTEFSTQLYAEYKAALTAMYILPYFAGSGQLVVRAYEDVVISSASVHPALMLGFLAGVLLVGVVAGYFVPKLPSDISRRGFGLYSWLAIFRANELHSPEMKGLERNMDMKKIEEKFGDLQFEFVPPTIKLRYVDEK